MAVISSNIATTEQLNALREDTSELKTPFDTVRDEICSALTKGDTRMKATEELFTEVTKMTQLVKDKYENASKDRIQWQSLKSKLEQTSLERIVKLNVGGNRYTASIDTLTRESDTYFTDLFSPNAKLEIDDSDGSIFIDRNGKIFSYILEYLRTDRVSDDVAEDEVLLYNLIIEAKHFRLKNFINLLEEAEIRVSGIFADGTLLDLEQKKKLEEFYGNRNQRWGLIYKASRDGFSSSTFHSCCNNKGPTMTIIRSNNNFLFGGYTSVAWTSCNNYQKDSTAFLFTLTNPHNIPPTKYLIKGGNEGNAIYDHTSYGPTFGGGHDIYLVNNSNSSNSSTNFPNSYVDTTGKGNSTFTGSNNFLVSDIEVFKQV